MQETFAVGVGRVIGYHTLSIVDRLKGTTVTLPSGVPCSHRVRLPSPSGVV